MSFIPEDYTLYKITQIVGPNALNDNWPQQSNRSWKNGKSAKQLSRHPSFTQWYHPIQIISWYLNATSNRTEIIAMHIQTATNYIITPQVMKGQPITEESHQ